jgi:hypothetical protein
MRMLDTERQENLLLLLKDLPDGDRLCHGDFHPWNIIASGKEVVVVDLAGRLRWQPGSGRVPEL